MPEGAEGPDAVPAVRRDGVPEGGLLPPLHGRPDARGGAAQRGLRRRHRPLPRRQLGHHRGDPRQEGLHLGIHLPRRLRRGGQGAEVSTLIACLFVPNLPLALQARQAALPEHGALPAAGDPVARAQVRPHKPEMDLAQGPALGPACYIVRGDLGDYLKFMVVMVALSAVKSDHSISGH